MRGEEARNGDLTLPRLIIIARLNWENVILGYLFYTNVGLIFQI